MTKWRLALCKFACQKGLRIPEDIGLVGFDDIPESAFFCPPLTTIQQDQYKVAKLAVAKEKQMSKKLLYNLLAVLVLVSLVLAGCAPAARRRRRRRQTGWHLHAHQDLHPLDL
jgi:hypothetical protein